MDSVEFADGQCSPAVARELVVPADVPPAFAWLGLYGIGVSLPMGLTGAFASLPVLFAASVHFMLGIACLWISTGLRRGQRWAIHGGTAVTLLVVGATGLCLFDVGTDSDAPLTTLFLPSALGLLCAVVCYRLIRLMCART